MILVDKALKAREEQGKPIRVGMIGAGFMGQGLTNQIVHSVPGMRMSAIYNRKPDRAPGANRNAASRTAGPVPTQPSPTEPARAGLPPGAKDPSPTGPPPRTAAA